MDFSLFETKIGYAFRNKRLLESAFTHRSYLNEHHDFPLGQNERLEFLGDAVLELAVTEFLVENYANPEGELTNWRAALVNAKTLAGIVPMSAPIFAASTTCMGWRRLAARTSQS